MAILALQTEEAKGLRPHEWDPQLFEQILRVDPSACEYLYCQLMAFYRRADEGMEEAALEHLENVLAKSARVGRALRHSLFRKRRRPPRAFESNRLMLGSGASGPANYENQNRSTP